LENGIKDKGARKIFSCPLFGFTGMRVNGISFFYPTFKFPLSAAGEERDGKRSDARVSQLE
jgi:hypothetical protein